MIQGLPKGSRLIRGAAPQPLLSLAASRHAEAAYMTRMS